MSGRSASRSGGRSATRRDDAGSRSAGEQAHRTARAVAGSAWGDKGARIGLASRGLVYLLLGYLVARIAFGALGEGSTSHTASGPGVAQAVAAQPGGRVVLVVLGIGLAWYAIFSLLDAILHHDRESPAAKRWGDRLLSAWGFVVFGAFSVYCFVTASSQNAGHQRAAQSDRKQAQWSAKVLGWPGGAVWLGILGVVLLVIAFFLVTRVFRASFRERLDRSRMGRTEWRLAVAAGVIGYLGRAFLFGIVGWFVLGAAIEDDPAHGQGVDGSARLLAASPAGGALLVAVAAGLAVYGLYVFVEAVRRKV